MRTINLPFLEAVNVIERSYRARRSLYGRGKNAQEGKKNSDSYLKVTMCIESTRQSILLQRCSEESGYHSMKMR